MVLGSKIFDEPRYRYRRDEIVGISKSGSKVETGVLFSLGGTSRCDCGRKIGAVHADEDPFRYS